MKLFFYKLQETCRLTHHKIFYNVYLAVSMPSYSFYSVITFVCHIKKGHLILSYLVLAQFYEASLYNIDVN